MSLTRAELLQATLIALSTPPRRGLVITRIKITTKPAKISYINGESVTIAGIVVHAYAADGTDCGVVPDYELMFTPDTAVAGNEYTNATGTITALRVVCDVLVQGHGYRGEVYTGLSGADYFGNVWNCTIRKDNVGITLITRYNGNQYAANESGNRQIYGIYWLETYPNEYGERNVPAWGGGWSTLALVPDGYFGHITSVPGNAFYYAPESSANPAGVSIDTLHSLPVQQTVTVSWPTPDGRLLSDTYTINTSQP